MIEHVHEHILGELERNSKVDQLFIVTAILLNILVLASNSAIATAEPTITRTAVVVIFILLAIVINSVVIFGLLKGRKMKERLIAGLLQMYEDSGVAKYYEPSIIQDYSSRYDAFILTVVFMGVVSIVVPIILL